MTRFLSKSCPSAASTGRKLWESGLAENALNWAFARRLLAPLTGLEPVHTAPESETPCLC